MAMYGSTNLSIIIAVLVGGYLLIVLLVICQRMCQRLKLCRCTDVESPVLNPAVDDPDPVFKGFDPPPYSKDPPPYSEAYEQSLHI